MINKSKCPKCGALKTGMSRQETDIYGCGSTLRGSFTFSQSNICHISQLTAALAASEAHCERLEALYLAERTGCTGVPPKDAYVAIQLAKAGKP